MHSTEIFSYPFALHECFGEYSHNKIEINRNFSQANFCMRQNDELQHCTVEEILALLSSVNDAENLALAQRIYQYTASITGRDPF